MERLHRFCYHKVQTTTPTLTFVGACALYIVRYYNGQFSAIHSKDAGSGLEIRLPLSNNVGSI